MRRAQLEFTRLQFHDGVNLWKGFIAYRAPTLPQWKRRNPTAGSTTFDANLQEEHLDFGDRLTDVVYWEPERKLEDEASVSTEDVEALLEYQVDQIQSKLPLRFFDQDRLVQ